jgi:hypothetical protein
MLALWELVIDVFHPLKNATTYRAGKTAPKSGKGKGSKKEIKRICL